MKSLVDERRCDWCKEPMPTGSRADAETCSKECRQARHRCRVNPAPAAAGEGAMRFAYADPPYPGLAKKYYSDDERCAEVDHEKLIAELVEKYPDGWALSTSAAALRDVLSLCPKDARVSIWVKGSRAGESYHERNAWEPVILWRGRTRKLSVAEDLDDVLIWGGRQHSHPGALVGMKNAPFCEWVFRQLGALAGDYLTDVFPGSGIVMRVWLAYGGRDPNENPAQQHLGFADIMTAPPTRLASTPSRLEEAQARIQASWDSALADRRDLAIDAAGDIVPTVAIGEASSAAGDTRRVVRSVIDAWSSLGLDDPCDQKLLEDALVIALDGEDIQPTEET